MSAVACPMNSTCENDALSTVANVLGVLTFAYAIAAGLWVYYRSFRNISRDVERILTNTRVSQLDALALPSDYWPADKMRSNDEGIQLTEIQMEASLAASQHVDGLEELAKQFLRGYGRSIGFWDRVRFILSQQEVAEKIVSVDRAFEHLNKITTRFEAHSQLHMIQELYTDRQDLGTNDLQSRCIENTKTGRSRSNKKCLMTRRNYWKKLDYGRKNLAHARNCLNWL